MAYYYVFLYFVLLPHFSKPKSMATALDLGMPCLSSLIFLCLNEWDDLFLIINRLPLSIYWHAVLYLYTNRGCWAEPAQDSHSYESLKSSFVARTALSCSCSKVSLEYLGKINQFTNLLRRVTKLNTVDSTGRQRCQLLSVPLLLYIDVILPISGADLSDYKRKCY